ncbi:hypothetical protein PRUB_a4384 [Pseudoalteromonas rubra]|uniref:Protein CR006 P-loop domain-containing protein n=1 Tax=Pseudoalteromonas rubra TaxID=43658 RepID=A0A8T0CA07_9GAMM|nr:AAA family ATPase [Pseudoalteromonas rubra]KAF7787208.1 hypothetical protein PRUB_a4384 [Pseudoalteromonas rubra]
MLCEIQITPPIATYRTPAKLNDLRCINYIFGANGTGKTTISRVIARAIGHEQCALTWQGGIELQCMVYNRDFVEQNFNQGDPLRGVFTLGENQVEAERQIADLQPEIKKLNDQISSLVNQLNGEDGNSGKSKELKELGLTLQKKCWKQKQLHDEYFSQAFIGVRNNAERFKEKVLAEQVSNNAELLSLDELKEKGKTVFSSNIKRVELLENLSAVQLVTLEKDPLLRKVIVGNQDVDIASLIDRLGNSDWVKQGLKYHEKQPDTCPFCQQPTDSNFASNLEAFFNEAYDNDMGELQLLQSEYKRTSNHLTGTVQSYTELNHPFLSVELFIAQAKVLFEILKSNHTKLFQKFLEPSRKIELDPVEPLIDQLQSYVFQANEKANQYNKTVANIEAEKSVLTGQVWRYVLNELSDDLKQHEQTETKLTQTIQGMELRLKDKEAKLLSLQKQVRELEKQTTSIQPTIKAINDLLDKFGFNSFSIGDADEGNHYQIIRENGDDASKTLSEGEKTFITFLYFYYLIKGAQSPSGITINRVVVFDDPISSLDSDILYIVSSLIKGVMEDAKSENSQIKQVFVLTHNVYFHKEISFSRTRPSNGTHKDESFWLVKKLHKGSEVERCRVNPIRSAYELLWEDIKSENISCVSLQNTLRRILENYFTMWGGMGKDEICSLFDGRDKLICQSLFSWVNDGSHSIHDDLYINHGEKANAAYLRVFQKIFDKAQQSGHYRMMMGIHDESVAPIDQTEDDKTVIEVKLGTLQ